MMYVGDGSRNVCPGLYFSLQRRPYIFQPEHLSCVVRSWLMEDNLSHLCFPVHRTASHLGPIP